MRLIDFTLILYDPKEKIVQLGLSDRHNLDSNLSALLREITQKLFWVTHLYRILCGTWRNLVGITCQQEVRN